MLKRVAIIGGGAAGLAAAVMAARCGANVVVLEAAERVGTKILRTGNGRCNLTNMGVGPADYNAPGFVRPVLETYPPERVRSIFGQLGLLTVEEREGRVYPVSNVANSVLDCLRLSCRAQGVELRCGFAAAEVKRSGDGFTAVSGDGSVVHADAVVVATGGGSDLLAMCGHGFAKTQPVLCPLKTETEMFRGLSGVRVHARVSAYDRADSKEPYACEAGEVLFRDYGLSGICIFDLSRLVEPWHILSIDLLPGMEQGQVEDRLRKRLSVLEGCGYAPSFEELLTGMFHPRVAASVLRSAGCRASARADSSQLEAVARTAKDWRTVVTGYGDPKQAQVTRGGALVDEFDPVTLESRRVPGLYAAGETLNVDGRCGGYNLHWAWASGFTAGHNAAR